MLAVQGPDGRWAGALYSPNGPRRPTRSYCCTGSACHHATSRRLRAAANCGTAPGSMMAGSRSPRASGSPRRASPRCSSCWHPRSGSTTTGSTKQSNGCLVSNSTMEAGTARRSVRVPGTGRSIHRSRPSMLCSSTSAAAVRSLWRKRWIRAVAFSSITSYTAHIALARWRTPCSPDFLFRLSGTSTYSGDSSTSGLARLRMSAWPMRSMSSSGHGAPIGPGRCTGHIQARPGFSWSRQDRAGGQPCVPFWYSGGGTVQPASAAGATQGRCRVSSNVIRQPLLAEGRSPS